MKKLIHLLLFFLVLTLQAKDRPNIIIIFTDDQGYADLGIFGHDPDVRTSQLDQLARDGVLFTRGYATAPQCVPSRAGLIAGRHQNSFGVDENQDGPLPLDEYTIAERLRDAGYATGMVGKWHLASSKEHGDPDLRFTVEAHLPHAFGFEEYWCGPVAWFHASHDLNSNAVKNPPQVLRDMRYRIDVQTEAALGFLERRQNDDRPFFLYLPYFAPHAPMDDPEHYMRRLTHVENHERQMGLASILAVDDGVGAIRQKLAEMGATEDTLIFFMSDNGAPMGARSHVGSRNDPVVGEKGMLTDGGIRVPYIAAWPGKIPAGQVNDEMVSTLDSIATTLAVANAPIDERVEGVNLMPFMTGEKSGSVHDALFWRWRSQAVMRSGQWTYMKIGSDRRYLWDNRELGSELASRNLIEQYPEIARTMEQRLIAHDEEHWPHRSFVDQHPDGVERMFQIHIDRSRPGEHPLQAPWWNENTSPAAAQPTAKEEPAASVETAGPDLPSDAAVSGWQVRQGGFQVMHTGVLRVQPGQDAQSAPFLTTRLPELLPPVTVSMEWRSPEPQTLRFTWRTIGSGREFLTHPSATAEYTGDGHWQTTSSRLPAEDPIQHIRIVFGREAQQPIFIRAIRFEDANGNVHETLFTAE